MRDRAWAVIAAAAVLIGIAGWLFVSDVHSDLGRQYGGDPRPEPGSTFCGSAYDIALLKGDGFMGGEVPLNQRAIDAECVPDAGRRVVLGTGLGTLGLTVGVGAGVVVVRRRRGRPVSGGRLPAQQQPR